MIVVGVTGGIGSGKSTVARLLARRGAVVVDADQIARQVASPGGVAYDALVSHFGPGIVTSDGSLDRPAIAARVFSDPAELAALNAITHPAIAAEMARQVAGHAGRDRVVVLDIPLLDEGARERYGLAGVVVVDTPVEVAVGRVVASRGLCEADAHARVGAQSSRERRLAMADVVIDNRGSLRELGAAITPVWAWMEGLVRSAMSVDGPVQEPADPDREEDHQEDR